MCVNIKSFISLTHQESAGPLNRLLAFFKVIPDFVFVCLFIRDTYLKSLSNNLSKDICRV